ncbi:hypothetical protein BURPS1710b_3281 [Burkholderia pseudomallei 1710b]|uniref:Uncharacterized protein n=1 Tax=Burkholderia pseudomallei (strain 1710b) TaxID=320372 RepID=Q3JP51_BURP1|nr:hypothetical protein BURPS1710b_3281 [Burkholderia pseudomallei 1710b]
MRRRGLSIGGLPLTRRAAKIDDDAGPIRHEATRRDAGRTICQPPVARRGVELAGSAREARIRQRSPRRAAKAHPHRRELARQTRGPRPRARRSREAETLVERAGALVARQHVEHDFPARFHAQQAGAHRVVEQRAECAAAAHARLGRAMRDQRLRTLRRGQLAFEHEPAQQHPDRARDAEKAQQHPCDVQIVESRRTPVVRGEHRAHRAVAAERDAMAPPRKAPVLRCERECEKRDASRGRLAEEVAEFAYAGFEHERRTCVRIARRGRAKTPRRRARRGVVRRAALAVGRRRRHRRDQRASRTSAAIVRSICSGSCVEQMKKRNRAAFSSTAG